MLFFSEFRGAKAPVWPAGRSIRFLTRISVKNLGDFWQSPWKIAVKSHGNFLQSPWKITAISCNHREKFPRFCMGKRSNKLSVFMLQMRWLWCSLLLLSSTMASRGAWPLVTADSLRKREVTFRTPRSGEGKSERGEDLSGDGLLVADYGRTVLHYGWTRCLPPSWWWNRPS